MPGIVRLSTKELNELIEVTEAAEGDATELKRLLAEVTEDERPRKPESRREWPLAAREGGMTTEEHVEALRQQSFIEQGNDLECMVCHNVTFQWVDIYSIKIFDTSAPVVVIFSHPRPASRQAWHTRV